MAEIVFTKPKASSGFLGGTSCKEPACQCRKHKRHRFDLWVGKIPWKGNGNPLQDSCLENPMDREAWWATVRGVAKSWTCLSAFTHSLKQSQSSLTKIKHSRFLTKETKNSIYELRTKPKHKLESKTITRCQVVNKAMKTKLTNMLKGKERNKIKNEYICKVKWR